MPDSRSMEGRLVEYKQRRRTTLLRQQFYAWVETAASGQLAQALVNAEEQLLRLEREGRVQESAEGRGVLLDTSDRGEKPGGILLGADTTGVDAQVLLRQSHVPTGIVHLLEGERTPLVTFRIRYVGHQYVRLRLTTFVEGYSAQAVDTAELHHNQSVEIHQLPTFFPDRLEHINEMTRATLHVRIDDLDGATEQHSTFPIWLLARTSAYISVEDPTTGSRIDLAPYLAAWVTPHAPPIMNLLRRAADLHPERRIVGYQTHERGVAQQVQAIYGALKATEIVYVNSVLSFGATQGEHMQRVRLPSESIETRSANCIDGTVLMASVLEAASLNAGIVLVPGHAFLAWEIQDGSGTWDYLETTMISTHDFEAACQAGRHRAELYRSLAERTGTPRFLRLLPLPELRVQHGVMPME